MLACLVGGRMRRKTIVGRVAGAMLLSMAAARSYGGASATGVYHVVQPDLAFDIYTLIYDGPDKGPATITGSGLSLLLNVASLGIDGYSGSATITGGMWSGGIDLGLGGIGTLFVTNGVVAGNVQVGSLATVTIASGG